MRSYKRWTAVVATASILSVPAAAQSPGTLLVGGFGQYTHFDKSWNLDTGLGNSLGFGLRFGGFFAPGWNLESDVSYTAATSESGVRFLNSAIGKGLVAAIVVGAIVVWLTPGRPR